MSKQRKSDVKDNNISSKLLGANLSDINIEKFRDLSQYRKERYDLGGQLTLPMLKTISNKFSADVIFTVVLPGQGIGSIEALGECVHLAVLGLSKNSIENLGPLKKLKELRIVDLSQNCINNVDALHNCTELVNLKLPGNMIKSVDSLRAIKTCPQLKNLHLQSLSGQNDNPICQLNNYRSNIFDEFPQIKRLDGVPNGVEFSNGSQIKTGKKKELKIDVKSIGPFYTNKFPSVPPYTAPSFAQEKSLKNAMGQCKSAIQDLQVRMRAILTM